MPRCDRCNNAPIIRRIDLCGMCVVEINQRAARIAELEAELGTLHMEKNLALPIDASESPGELKARLVLAEATLRIIAKDSAGLGSCCLDDALFVRRASGNTHELQDYQESHDCTDAACLACHALGHPHPCLGGKE